MKRREYEVYTNKVDSEKNIAIVSDMHISDETPTEKLIDTLDTLSDIKPTHIVMPGDLYDVDVATMFNRKVTSFINDATDIAPVFYVKGDSEDRGALYSMKMLPKGLDNGQNKKFHVLNEENKEISLDSYTFKGINFTGLKLPQEYYGLSEFNKARYILNHYRSYLERMSQRLQVLKEKGYDEFSVLLCHDPAIIDAITHYNLTEDEQLNFNLMISGHNHGGIYPNSLRPLFKMAGKGSLYPSYTDGIHCTGDEQYGIVSEGITKYPAGMGIMSSFERFHEGTIENVRVLKK